MTALDHGPTADQLHTVACPTCRARPAQECRFTRNRGSAREGDSMGDSCHNGRYDAYREATTTTTEGDTDA